MFARRGSDFRGGNCGQRASRGGAAAVYRLAEAEMRRAKAVHAAHAKELMSQPGVQGVGITSSVDSPGEAALMIFVIRGARTIRFRR